MTAAELIHDLAEELRRLDIKFAREYQQTAGELVKVQVFENYLPENDLDQSEFLPCILVEWLETEDNLKSDARIKVGLTFATYAKESDGWLDCFHLVEQVRMKLLTWRVIGRKYRLMEATWQTPEGDQPRPFFYAAAILTYSAYLPQDLAVSF